MDAERAVRIIRVARLGNRTLKARRRMKGMFDDQQRQIDHMIDTIDLIRAIRDKRVIASDVHTCTRFAIRFTPTIYRKIIKATKSKKKQDAKA